MFQYFQHLISRANRFPLSEIKFKRLTSLVLPLATQFKSQALPQANWSLTRVSNQNGVQQRHLVLPRFNRVNERCYLHDDGLSASGVEVEKLEVLYQCKNLNPELAVDRLLIGLHPNQVVSLMALPRPGNSMKLCKALSGNESFVSIKDLHNPDLVNQHSYQFAPRAGADPRARASLQVRCDNEADIRRLQCFMAGIQTLGGFSQPITALWEDIRKQMGSQTSWVVQENIPLVAERMLFNGYPNGIADLQRQTAISSFHPDDVLNYPNTIPAIHLAVLAQDEEKVVQLLKNDPMLVYQRCPEGRLPIELAEFCLNSSIAAQIFNSWQALPKSRQWASQRFIEAANNMVSDEQNNILVFDEEFKQSKVRQYFEKILPCFADPLTIYQSNLSEDRSKLNEGFERETADWIAMESACLSGNLELAKAIFAQRLPLGLTLFKGILVGYFPMIETALKDSLSVTDYEMQTKLPERLRHLLRMQNEMVKVLSDNGKRYEQCRRIFDSELELWTNIRDAVRQRDSLRLKVISRNHFNERSGRSFKARILFGDSDWDKIEDYLKDEALLFEHFDIYLALYQKQTSKALALIRAQLQAIRSQIERISTTKPQKSERGLLHHQAILGVIQNFDSFVEEKRAFDQYKLIIKEILGRQATHHKEYLLSAQRQMTPLPERLIFYINSLVIDTSSLEDLEADVQKYLSLDSTKDRDLLQAAWVPIAKRKRLDLDALAEATANYKRVCKATDENIFQLFSACLVWQTGSQVYLQNLNVERSIQFPPSILASSVRNINGYNPGRPLRHCSARDDFRLDSIIKSNLLSYEAQDSWGYTPLLLAVAANQLETVKSFLERGIGGDIVVPLKRTDCLYYSLLDNSPSREMTALLLHYYLKPEFIFSWKEGMEDKLPILLMYHHHLSHDAFGQSLLDYIAAGYHYDLALLDVILEHRDSFVQEGPYDPEMPVEVQKRLEKHNEVITFKIQRLAQRQTSLQTYSFFQKRFASLGFKVKDGEAPAKSFYSLLKTSAELNAEEQDALAGVFARQFELPGDLQSFQKLLAFFKEKVLSQPAYIFDVFYDSHHLPVAFCCFKIKYVDNPVYGRFNVIYASIAACETQAARYNLLTSSFKMVLAAKKISDAQNLPLKFYGRFGRPGIAYLLIPKEAQVSTKYHQTRGLVRFIAGLFDNAIEMDGSSLPPVQSKAVPAGRNARLEEYNYLLDECLHARSDASLPLIFDIDDMVYHSWFKRLSQTCAVTEAYIEELARDERLGPQPVVNTQTEIAFSGRGC
ncbi:hypothetical protein Lqui_1992 [Legionella quinlivanii]|uniref:Uncharacterized protein n=1 Tax=Legionella quinlivanii TaxID=45073 RepID=A0A0W0XUB3_9GAMM|nr:hypothetical protein [Legionella quinlivanii]KTD48181.1 hypothetical protein Lqui_1992 [Legionella quinlivanii]SEF99655.1 hypothetical protein SAMN02746093_01623 [Legionella quinlivanii DSM 21216]STY11370.1 Uncharacterised protein [Legionella quinlivanii]